MARPPSTEPAAVLRAALAGPYPVIRAAATEVIRHALEAPTVAARCRELRIARATYYLLARDFPGVFGGSEKSTDLEQKSD